MGGASGTGFGGSAGQATQGGQQGGFGGQQGGFGGQQGGFGGQQGGFGGQQGVFGSFGGGQQGGFGGQQGGYIGIDPVPQFQNPYGPTIYNPYSPADQRQFGFQTPFQQQQQQFGQSDGFPNQQRLAQYQQQKAAMGNQMNPEQQQFGQPGIGLPPHEQGLGGRGGLQRVNSPGMPGTSRYTDFYNQAVFISQPPSGQRDGFPNQQRLAPNQQQQALSQQEAMRGMLNGTPQQPQRPAFLDNPEYQGYQKQAEGLNQQINDYVTQSPMYQQLQNPQGNQNQREDLNRQMDAYVKQSPMYQQLQDLQGKMRGFQDSQQPQPEPVSNNQDMVFRPAVMPPPESVAEEYNPAQQTQGQQQLEQRMLENNRRVMQQTPQERQRIQQELMFNPLNRNQQQQTGFGQLMGGPMGGLLNRPRQGPGPGQFGYNGAPQMNPYQQSVYQYNLQNPNNRNPYTRQPPSPQELQYDRQPRGMTMDMPQRYGRQPSPPPNPYQMYGGLGGLFNMQNAFTQQPQQSTQAQINDANRQFLKRGEELAPKQTPRRNPFQQPEERQDFRPDFSAGGA